MSEHERAAPSLASVVPRVVELLAAAGFRHALIGGLAVGIWVEPRATRDIDFVVGARLVDVEALLAAARAAGFEVRAGEVERLRQSYLTRIWSRDHEGEPLMIDLLLDEHAFYDSVLARGRSQRLGDGELTAASPEDVMLLKLLAARPQDLVDAGRLVETYRAELDRGYLERWAAELGVEGELAHVLDAPA